MTTTNMFLNFGGKWDSPPFELVMVYMGVVFFQVNPIQLFVFKFFFFFPYLLILILEFVILVVLLSLDT